MYQMYRTLFDGIASSDRMREKNFQTVYTYTQSQFITYNRKKTMINAITVNVFPHSIPLHL